MIEVVFSQATRNGKCCPHSVILDVLHQHLGAPEGFHHHARGEAAISVTGDQTWSLDFYAGTDYVTFRTEDGAYHFLAVPDQEDVFLSPLGNLIRRWYNEVEYSALDGYDGADIVIPDEGRDYLAAALAYFRCCYITLEEDGWHGVLAGAGF